MKNLTKEHLIKKPNINVDELSGEYPSRLFKNKVFKL